MEPARVQGYDCSFVTQPPDEITTDCSICFLILRDPSQLECGHVFCAGCIERALRDSGNECPICKQANPASFLDQNLRRTLARFRVYCVHSREREAGEEGEEGCGWSGELGQLEAHLNSSPTSQTQLDGCQFVQVKCGSCEERVRRSSLQEHQASLCPQRTSMCPHCNYISTYINITERHLPQCQKVPCKCPHCDTVFERQELTVHVDHACVLAPVPCDFQPVGCLDEILRVEMATHMREKRFVHAQLLIEATSELEDNPTNHTALFRNTVLDLSSENAALTEECKRNRERIDHLQTMQLVLALAAGVLLLIAIVLVFK